jgi:hypothetical protein
MQEWVDVVQGPADQTLVWLRSYPDRIALILITVLVWIRGSMLARRLRRVELKVTDAARALSGIDIQVQRLLIVGLRDRGSAGASSPVVVQPVEYVHQREL